MRVIGYKCPNCSANLNVKRRDREIRCPYCDQTFIIDNKEIENSERSERIGIIYSSMSIAFLLLALAWGNEYVAGKIILYIFSLIFGILSLKKSRKRYGLVGLIGSSIILVFLAVSFVSGIVSGTANALNSKSPYLHYDEAIVHEEYFMTPSEEFCKERLSKVDCITEVMAATEYHDPNGKLHLDGGYTADIFFAVEGVDLDSIKGDDLVDKGTMAGGSIEVYLSQEDADARMRDFESVRKLAVGGVLKEGTVIIRTSSQLSVSKQQELAEKIVKALDAE